MLRLTYDAAFVNETGRVKNSGKNSSRGVYYNFVSPHEAFKNIRISSYAEENRSGFDYLANTSPATAKIVYSKMPDNSNAYTMTVKLDRNYYIRWEWIYKGRGIVAEALTGREPDHALFDGYIREHLKVFY